jgi:uncharacterized protein DUF4258
VPVGYTPHVVRWDRFDPAEYDISFNDAKLAAHDISRYDVMEVLENGIYVIRNKRAANRYRVRGRTDAGRPLELIVVVEGSDRLRFITGWDL